MIQACFALLLLMLAACQRQPACCREHEGTEPAATRSLHLLDASWTDAGGRDTRLAEIAAPVRVLTLIYAHCQYACPATVATLRKTADALPAGVRPRARFVLVTMDPERDTPEALAEWARAHGLTAPEWTLLSGDLEATRALAAAVGFRFKRVGAEFSHSNAIYVLDAQGTVAHTHTGAPDPAALAAAIAKVARGGT